MKTAWATSLSLLKRMESPCPGVAVSLVSLASARASWSWMPEGPWSSARKVAHVKSLAGTKRDRSATAWA
eukprot:12928338-Alexandrium_andersonii.AAC.1